MLINISPLKVVFVMVLHFHMTTLDLNLPVYVATFSTQTTCEFALLKFKAARPDTTATCEQDDLK